MLHAIAPCSASRGATLLPRMLENMLTRHSAAALRTAGYEQEAAALRAALKLCRKAASAAASAAEASSGIGPAAAALASIARQRADFWRAARRPWKVGRRLMHPGIPLVPEMDYCICRTIAKTA